jgi:hypothetical protein
MYLSFECSNPPAKHCSLLLDSRLGRLQGLHGTERLDTVAQG